MNLRVGSGFDVHKFEEGRELFLGGILIENHIGLAGHSDADVLIHAVIDALLGATAIGDIGELFPDTDNAFKNIRSTILLEKVVSELVSSGWEIVNVDSKPKPKRKIHLQQVISTRKFFMICNMVSHEITDYVIT